MSRAVRVRVRAAVVVAVVAVVAVGCAAHPPPIPGPSPLRYRDEIFTAVTKTADITYGTAEDQEGNLVTLKLDVYRPTGDTRTNRPLVVFVHGGGFRSGNKGSPEILDETSVLTKKGYVTASISYRLSENGCSVPNAECVNAIVDAREDAQNAVRFLRTNAATYGVDASRIAIAGTSAGAITALEVGYNTDNPGSPSAAVSGAISLSGANILSQVGPGDAEALLFHGTNDNLVPYQWASDTVDDARAAGLLTYLVRWEGQGHVPYVQNRSQILDLTTNFLYRAFDLP